MRLVVSLAAIAVAFGAWATQAVHSSVEGLARGSALVVRGRVVGVSARRSEDGRRIFTFAEVETTSTWRGAPRRRVTVLAPGGAVGGIAQRVEGAPTFAVGEEVVVFLSPAEGGAHRVSGLGQGKFTLDGDVARPQTAAIRFTGARVLEGERRVEPMSVAELERRVRSAT